MKDKKLKIHQEPNTKQIIHKKRQPKRIDLSIISRLLQSLYYNSGIKKTKIAIKCNLSYDKCVLYLNWLEMMELIERQKDEDGFETIVLSQRGSELYKRKLGDN
ncbi:MAG: hypothetical protein E6K91_01810 [Thaumarchaeota archaeon]|nr:MAG: hypothetical protein E6K91_01810 [Nitrososphaerota archaeon]